MMSTAYPIDVSIFVGFLVINLVVGLRYGRYVKTFRDYVLGGRSFSTATLVATIVATWVTGRYLTVRIDNIYQNGLFFVIIYLCAGGGLLFIGWLFAMRMTPFLQNVSVAEAMGRVYGKPVRTITAIWGVLVSVGLTALQLGSGKSLFSGLFGWDSVYGTIATGGIIIIYSTLGGIRSVTFTDIFQFLTFGTLLPILALAIWNSLNDFDEVRHMIRETPHWNIREFLTSPDSALKWSFLTLIPLYSIPSFSPAIFQRAIMAKNVYQIRKSFLYAALLYLLIILLIIWIALLTRTHNSNLSYDGAFQYIVDHYASSIGLRGLFLSGFMAMIMSTADSNLNVASSMLVNDIIIPLTALSKHPLLKRLSTDRAQLMMARAGSFILGLLALFLSLDSIEYSRLSITSISAFRQMRWVLPFVLPWHFYTPVISMPLLLGILGFRSATRTVLMGMAAGFLTVYLWIYLLPHTLIDGSIPGMLANLTVLMGSHYLFKTPGGWQALESNSPLVLERTARHQAWRRRWHALRSFTLYPYLKNNLPAQEVLYFLLGLYILITTYVAFYTVENVDTIARFAVYQSLYYAVLLVSTAFITLPVWPRTIRNYRFVAYLWPIGIGTTLFFTGTLLAILSEFHPVQVMIVMVNFLMVILLLRWPLAFSLAFMGIALAIFFFKQHTPGAALSANVSDLLQFRVLYGLFIFASFVVAFLKGKQVYRELVASHTQLNTDRNFVNQFVLDMYRNRANVLQEAHECPATEQKDPVDNFHLNPSKEQLRAENEALHHHAYRLDTYNRYLKQVLHGTQHPISLVVESVALESLWKKVLESTYQYKGTPPVATQYNTTCELLQADHTKVQRLLTSALTYTVSQQQDKRSILLGLEDTQLAYSVIAIPGYIKYVRAVRMTITTEQALPKLKAWYLGSIDHIETEWPQNLVSLPIIYNQQIVEAHYGFTEITHHPGGLTLVYVIPWDVREVRPPVMDQWPSLSTPVSLKASPISSLEAPFIGVVRAKTSMDTKLLQRALQFIRQYYKEDRHNTDESCYSRAIAVAQVALEYTTDSNTLLAALMHGIIDKTHCSLQHIALHFSPLVQRIVDGVACVDSRLQSKKKLQLSPFENRQKLLEARDERILYLALAIRLYDIRNTRRGTSIEKQQKTAQETLDVLVPAAAKLGLKRMAKELEERCIAMLREVPNM